MHERLTGVYEYVCCDADDNDAAVVGVPANNDKHELAAKKDKYKGIRDAFDKAIDHIHQNEGFAAKDLNSEPVKNLTEATFSVLKDAVDTGITHEVPETMRKALEKSVYVFSGLKTYASLKEASTFLFDDKGNIKPVAQVKQDIKAIDAAYNENYIEAEYRFAIQSAQGADNWHQYQQDGDRYYLQFRTAGDDKVRKEHAALNGITLAFDDVFWELYWTPLGWRCRCRIIQVRKSKYELSDSDTATKLGEAATTALDKNGKNKLAMFRFNPGKQQTIFPPDHPYSKVAPAKAKDIINKQADDK